jgi:hypothetical protein
VTVTIHKLKIEFPTADEIARGLSPHEQHPKLAPAETAATEAEQALDHRRRDLAALEKRVAELPGEIQAGRTAASDLVETMRKRDAAALMIRGAEQALTKATEQLLVEQKAAKLAVDRERDKRTERLERIAAEISPILGELRASAFALVRDLGPGAIPSLSWPSSPADDAAQRAFASIQGVRK